MENGMGMWFFAFWSVVYPLLTPLRLEARGVEMRGDLSKLWVSKERKKFSLHSKEQTENYGRANHLLPIS
jgi:hypothetical protein